MARYDDDEPSEGTVLGAIQWLTDQLAMMADRLAALERLIGLPAPEPAEEW
jgi:hypothetical protein